MATSLLTKMETLYRALADRTRLRLLNLMSGQEICVCFLVEVLRTNQPKISRHLAYLRRAGIVDARREGKWVHYRILTPQDSLAAEVLKATLNGLSQDKQVQRDIAVLTKVCCVSDRLVQLQRAPLPARIGATGMRDEHSPRHGVKGSV